MPRNIRGFGILKPNQLHHCHIRKFCFHIWKNWKLQNIFSEKTTHIENDSSFAKYFVSLKPFKILNTNQGQKWSTCGLGAFQYYVFDILVWRQKTCLLYSFGVKFIVYSVFVMICQFHFFEGCLCHRVANYCWSLAG